VKLQLFIGGALRWLLMLYLA